MLCGYTHSHVLSTSRLVLCGVQLHIPTPLQWRHNDHDSVSNHQPHGCLLNLLFRRRSKKISKLRATGLYVGNSPGPVNSPHKGPVTRKMFPFDDVIMTLCSNGAFFYGVEFYTSCAVYKYCWFGEWGGHTHPDVLCLLCVCVYLYRSCCVDFAQRWFRPFMLCGVVCCFLVSAAYMQVIIRAISHLSWGLLQCRTPLQISVVSNSNLV